MQLRPEVINTKDGAKVKYTRPCPETTTGPFVCVCGATGTETREGD